MSKSFVLHHGDCREWITSLPAKSIDAVITDPPYHLGRSTGSQSMAWDSGDIVFDPLFWASVREVVVAGGHLAVFGSARKYHRLALAIEDSGWQLCDPLYWAQSHIIRKHSGALRPSVTPIVVARNGGKAGFPCIEEATLPTGSMGSNLIYSHTPGCKQVGWRSRRRTGMEGVNGPRQHYKPDMQVKEHRNIINGFVTSPAWRCEQGCAVRDLEESQDWAAALFTVLSPQPDEDVSPLFYAYRPGQAEIAELSGHRHPTQKPLNLMRWLVNLLSKEGDTVLDPFAGTATTGMAALQGGREFYGAEADQQYYAMALKRLESATRTYDSPCPVFVDPSPRLFDPDA